MIFAILVTDARTLRLVVFCVSMALTGARSARAQPAAFEWFAGYSYLKDPSHSVLTATARDDGLPLGWAAGMALPLWRAVSIAADISGHYKRQTTFFDDVSLSYHTLAAGPRASARIGPFVEFGELLAGIAIAHGDAFGVTTHTTALLLQGGGGLDYPFQRRLAIRGEIDYRRLTGSDSGRVPANQLRVVAAIVVR
jgi:hypothetical protein